MPVRLVGYPNDRGFKNFVKKNLSSKTVIKKDNFPFDIDGFFVVLDIRK